MVSLDSCHATNGYRISFGSVVHIDRHKGCQLSNGRRRGGLRQARSGVPPARAALIAVLRLAISLSRLLAACTHTSKRRLRLVAERSDSAVEVAQRNQ